MTRLKFLTFVFICACSATSSLAEEDYDDHLLFRKQAWAVTLTTGTEGAKWCSAESTNRAGQTLSLVAYPSSQLTFFVFDSRWKLAERPVNFIVDIDYSRWNIRGTADKTAISLTFNEPSKTYKFLNELKNSSAVALYNTDERRLGTFSLSGSSAAIASLFQCWQRISETKMPTDPFKTQSDPF